VESLRETGTGTNRKAAGLLIGAGFSVANPCLIMTATMTSLDFQLRKHTKQAFIEMVLARVTIETTSDMVSQNL